MNPSAAIVISASPIPMTTWTPTIVGRPSASGIVPLSASSTAMHAAPATTDAHAAIPPPGSAPAPRRPCTRASARYRANPPSVPTTPMLKMFAPITTRPPSWKTSAWTPTTQAMTSVAAHGPSRTGREDATEQVPGRPADHLEVEHLGREDERRHHAQQRDRLLVERLVRLPDRDRQDDDRHQPTSDAATGTDRKPSGRGAGAAGGPLAVVGPAMAASIDGVSSGSSPMVVAAAGYCNDWQQSARRLYFAR